MAPGLSQVMDGSYGSLAHAQQAAHVIVFTDPPSQVLMHIHNDFQVLQQVRGRLQCNDVGLLHAL